MVTHFDGSEDPRTVIQWKKNVEQICKGSGIKKIDAVVKMTAALCAGSAQDAYLTAIGEMCDKRKENAEDWKKANPLTPQQEDEADDDYATHKSEWEDEAKCRTKLQRRDHTTALQAVILDAMPYKAITKEKRYMRRFMKKPPNMRFRTYAAHIMKINKEKNLELPPFKDTEQVLKKDDLVDILLNGMPTAWEDKMDKHNFDPEAHPIQELIDFCERLESVEQCKNQQTNPAQKESQNRWQLPRKQKAYR